MYVRAVCVSPCVLLGVGGVSEPEPVGCAGELGEEAGEVRPLCLCRQKTLEGTGKGNGKPEGWEVAGVAERDLSTTDFKILIP